MSDLQTKEHTAQLRQERALERAQAREIRRELRKELAQERLLARVQARALRRSWWRERAAALVSHYKIILLISFFPTLLLTGLARVSMAMDWPPPTNTGLLTARAFVMWAVVTTTIVSVIVLALDATRSIARDALDARQLKRVRTLRQGDVPPGALEEVSAEDTARGAVSLAEQTSAGALSDAREDAHAPADPRP